MSNEEFLEVSATINAPLDQVWDKWTQAEPEQENPLDLQQGGWQAILNQFKTYCQQ